MNTITWYLLWLFVFSTPWGVVSSIPGIGTITRLLGMMALGVGVLTILSTGRLRPPGAVFWFLTLFVVSAVMSLAWTVDAGRTVAQLSTYVQGVLLVGIVGQFVRTRVQVQSLLLAFCLGASVLAFDLLLNFAAGRQIDPSDPRYTASGTNPNYVGFTLVIALPMAWHLFSSRRGAVQAIGAAYCLIAPVAMLLTAGRGAFVAGLAALSIIPLTLRLDSFASRLRVGAVLLLSAIAIGWVVPQPSWERLFTIRQEIEARDMSGRGQIWNAGLEVLQERPFVGAGAGAFPAAVESTLSTQPGAHNMALALLVEHGVFGFGLFAALLGACAWAIWRLPWAERALWAVLMATWLIMGMSADVHIDKITWLLFGLLEANRAILNAPMRRGRPVAPRAVAAA